MMKTLGLTLFLSLALPLNAMAANGLQKQKTYFPFNSYALWDNTTAGWEWKMHKIENGLQQPLYSLPRNIKSQRLVCYNLTQGLLIEGKNQRQSMAPASMTKLMTLVVACDLITDWQKPMEVTKAICARVEREGASKAGFKPGELVMPKDLLYGMMLPSGADACWTLAEKLLGSEEAFVLAMNARARGLGMNHTNFTNVVGLTDSYHYSTAEDISKLLAYVISKPNLRRIISAPVYVTAPTLQHPKGIALESTLWKFLPEPNLSKGQIIGGKTGYTRKAGQCLASFAYFNGDIYTLVTAGAPGEPDTDQQHIIDSSNIYNML